MKEAELRKFATCGMCGRKVLESGLPMFWRVTVERFGMDMKAVQRQMGLTMQLGGNAFLASAMGADEDLALPIVEPVTIAVCESCCTESTCVAALAEK